jgi:competence protein ComEA
VSDLPDVPGLPDRPPPPRTVIERVRSWVEWVGPGRIVGSAFVVVAVLAVAYWLVKPPPATTESTLPFARSSTTVPRGGGSSANATGATSAPSSAPSTTAVEVVVHVAGAVRTTGVYRLPSGSRVIDAVQRAGGLTADAQPDAVNLAAPLADGERVYVPRLGEAVPVSASVGAASTAPPGPIDINRATADELDALPGIGPTTAAAIVAHRDQNGPFGSVDDLADVRGIGPAKMEALRGLVTT